MNRRKFLNDLVLAAAALPFVKSDVSGSAIADLNGDWLTRWEKNILGRARSRCCDKEMGEQLGWGGLSATPWFFALEEAESTGTLQVRVNTACKPGAGSRNNGWHRCHLL